MAEDFAYWGLSLMVCELEDERSHATAFEVGLTLNENENVRQWRKVGEEKGAASLPDGNENLVLSSVGERTRVDISGHIARFDRLEINKSFLRIDSADIHLASINAER